jgi:hypothetical protein
VLALVLALVVLVLTPAPALALVLALVVLVLTPALALTLVLALTLSTLQLTPLIAPSVLTSVLVLTAPARTGVPTPS